ncbi:hypothetical protein GW17_00048582 [Ensete ventricosum]|nr:hypothetical protein GW17_00048582 [Ensete ventricosum]RZR82601.1 hypothetical protein BHM03_00009052 [Ensete ventricosum]
MEVKIPRSVETKTGNEREKPSSRLQKQAPATLQLDATKLNTDFVMGADDAAASAPIPLLSPLLLSPSPFWDTEESNSAEEDKGDGGGSQTCPSAVDLQVKNRSIEAVEFCVCVCYRGRVCVIKWNRETGRRAHHRKEHLSDGAAFLWIDNLSMVLCLMMSRCTVLVSHISDLPLGTVISLQELRNPRIEENERITSWISLNTLSRVVVD